MAQIIAVNSIRLVNVAIKSEIQLIKFKCHPDN